MQLINRNNNDWRRDVNKTSGPTLFGNLFRYLKVSKIFGLILFLFWIGLSFFTLVQLGPIKGGFLVPISILKYEDLSLSHTGLLRVNLDSLKNKLSLNLFPTLSGPLQTEKEILDFLTKKNKAGIKENIVFRIDGRALPSGDGDIILLPSNYGASSTANGIELSEILCLIMEFPCRNRLVLIDVMAPWNNISHGGVFWDLGYEINKTLELAKVKYKNKHGASVDKINFHLWGASGEGGFSRQLGEFDSLFYDQFYYTLDNVLEKKLSGLVGLFTLKDIATKVNFEVNKKSIDIFGGIQKPLFVGWGKAFPVHPQKKILKVGGSNSDSPFVWPEEYIKAWNDFDQLKTDNGYAKNPKIMQAFLMTLLYFRDNWINSNSDKKVLEEFKIEYKKYFNLMSELQKNSNKLTSFVSVVQVSGRFSLEQLKQYRTLFNNAFGNLKTEKDDSLMQFLKSKEFTVAIEKLSPLELEFLLLDSIIESSSFNFSSLNAIFDFITSPHREPLAFETLGLRRILNSSKKINGIKDIKIAKLCLKACYECGQLFDARLKNDLMFKGMQKAMNSLNQGDWFLEHGDGSQIAEIQSFYEDAEKTARLTLVASKSFEKAVTLLDSSLIELYQSSAGAFPGFELVLPSLEGLEKLGKYVLNCELDLDRFPSFSSGFMDEKNINNDLADFVYSTDQVVSPVELTLNNLKNRINGYIIPELINDGHSLLGKKNYLANKFGYHLLVFADHKNIKKMLDLLALKVNEIKDLLYSENQGSDTISFPNEDQINNKATLPSLRVNLIKVHASLMRSIGLDILADKLSGSLEKVDISQPRSKGWSGIIKMLPKLYYSDFTTIEPSLKYPVKDRLSYIFYRTNGFSENTQRSSKVSQRVNSHLIMVENVINNRFSYGLDGDFCFGVIQELRSYSLPLVPIRRFVPIGNSLPLIVENSKNGAQRGVSFRGLVYSKKPIKMQLIDNNKSKINAFLSDITYENVPGKSEIKISGKINVSLLMGESLIVPEKASVLLKIDYDFQSDYFSLPVIINPNRPELEIVLKQINGGPLDDKFKVRTSLEGEKYSFFVRNNSPKPREAYVKMSSSVDSHVLSDCKVLCPENAEVPVVFNPKIAPLKSDTGFSFEFSSNDNIVLEISDNLKPGVVFQKRSFNPIIIDPTDYVLVEDAKYYPAQPPLNNSPAIRFRLRSQDKKLSPQPFVELNINQLRTPGFKSGIGATSLFLKPDTSVEVFIKDLVFDSNLSDSGEIFLNIDNFKRLVRYGFSAYPFGSPYSLNLINKNEIRFSGDFNFSDQKILTFPIETDGGSENTTLEVGLWDEVKNGKMPQDFSGAEMHTSFLSGRKKHFKLLQKPGEGKFTLFSFVDDWKIQWDVSGSSGRKVIYAWMKDEKGEIVSKISKKVTIDYTPPKVFNFQVLSDSVVAGKSLRFGVIASDQESGISNIKSLFLKTSGDKPVLVDIPLAKSDDFPDQYVGSFLVPLDLKGPLEVSTTAVNGLGRSFTLTKTIQLSAVPGSSEVTCIKGVIKEGGRLQPGLVVTLYDTKSKKSKATTSNESGEFIFENLDPLNYKISVEKPSSSRFAAKNIDLKIGQTVNLILELLQ